MKKINRRRILYIARHKYRTLNTAVIVVAFLVAGNWVWGSLSMMERNYALQKELDAKARELQIAELEVSSLDLEKRYYQTREYQELAAREDLGLVIPGERVLILPANSEAVKNKSTSIKTEQEVAALSPNNINRWLDFLFGRNVRKSIN